MATIVLAAAGGALGASIGGAALGVSAAVLGRAAGASVGRSIDQKLLGSGSAAVETGRVDRFRLTGSNEGEAVQQVYGRMRVAGHVIWASQFTQTESTSGGSKGAGPSVTNFSYSANLAIGLCEGTISGLGRIWADGVLVSQDDLNMRVYKGTQEQLADPKISAVEGAGQTPAYRGTAYVVFEDLSLSPYGNRVPQFTFEVMRPAPETSNRYETDLDQLVQGVALIPGTGEYALAQTPVFMPNHLGEEYVINQNSPFGGTDFDASTQALRQELPNCKSSLLVVSWFGNDLRCGKCSLQPKVEQKEFDPKGMPWSVCGVSRNDALTVARVDGRPIYGGTPTDSSVVEAIKTLKSRGQDAVFYPFILMEQLEGNGLENPWTGDEHQPVLPWRGRITLSSAPGREASPDGSAVADQQVADFMGGAKVSDFSILNDRVQYSGPNDWGYRRFILHYAYLCKLAGGVSAFCIGSEMRALTQIRGAGGAFPAVEALRLLAGEVRAILGDEVKLSYAADWSEYHGYQPQGTADKIFHLDSLWSDENIDFIGIDNYMPLADWRDIENHEDADFGSIYNLDYLEGNVAGGEGYDWYYHSDEAREAQIRTKITDGDGEPWVWRYKDLKGWWSNTHHNRIAGKRQSTPTSWVPQSKPFWFTEYGCAAIDKGANQPNKFLDPKSSESQTPHYSNGARDDFMQLQYIRAVNAHFSKSKNNPASQEYEGEMLDLARAHVWAWDTRPFPFFPANEELWSDGGNYTRGHWLNGRATSRSLASVVGEILRRSEVEHFDLSKLHGVVRGYIVSDVTTARSALQPLLQVYGLDVFEKDGVLHVQNKQSKASITLTQEQLAQHPEQENALSVTRAPADEAVDRLQLEYIDSEGDYEASVCESLRAMGRNLTVSRSSIPLALTQAEAQNAVSRWSVETTASQEVAHFALPPSLSHLGAGDVIEGSFGGETGLFRIDQVEESGLRMVEAIRLHELSQELETAVETGATSQGFYVPSPVQAHFLDLPLVNADEAPHAPYVAASASRWPGNVAVFSSAQDSDYKLRTQVSRAAIMGQLQTSLAAGPVARWDRQSFTVQLIRGALSSKTEAAVLSGENLFAVGHGDVDNWEILQAVNVEPLGEGRFKLSKLLRGQFGSDVMMPSAWKKGASFVVLDERVPLYPMDSKFRSTERHIRYGASSRPMTDASYRYLKAQFNGAGLRPYRVVHLKRDFEQGGDSFSWVRQTRIDGDTWSSVEVPLGEDFERYQIQVLQNGTVKRELSTSKPRFSYAQADKISEVGNGAYEVKVAQVSARYGIGPFTSLHVEGV